MTSCSRALIGRMMKIDLEYIEQGLVYQVFHSNEYRHKLIFRYYGKLWNAFICE